LNTTLEVVDYYKNQPYFINYPNPFGNNTTFSFKNFKGNGTLKIYNILGKMIFETTISRGEKTINWNSENFTNGIYIAKLLTDNNELATLKLVLKK